MVTNKDNPRCYCPDCGADLGNFDSNRIRMDYGKEEAPTKTAVGALENPAREKDSNSYYRPSQPISQKEAPDYSRKDRPHPNNWNQDEPGNI